MKTGTLEHVALSPARLMTGECALRLELWVRPDRRPAGLDARVLYPSREIHRSIAEVLRVTESLLTEEEAAANGTLALLPGRRVGFDYWQDGVWHYRSHFELASLRRL